MTAPDEGQIPKNPQPHPQPTTPAPASQPQLSQPHSPSTCDSPNPTEAPPAQSSPAAPQPSRPVPIRAQHRLFFQAPAPAQPSPAHSPSPAQPSPAPDSKYDSKRKTRSKLGQNFVKTRSKRFGQNIIGTQTLNNFN